MHVFYMIKFTSKSFSISIAVPGLSKLIENTLRPKALAPFAWSSLWVGVLRAFRGKLEEGTTPRKDM